MFRRKACERSPLPCCFHRRRKRRSEALRGIRGRLDSDHPQLSAEARRSFGRTYKSEFRIFPHTPSVLWGAGQTPAFLFTAFRKSGRGASRIPAESSRSRKFRLVHERPGSSSGKQFGIVVFRRENDREEQTETLTRGRPDRDYRLGQRWPWLI